MKRIIMIMFMTLMTVTVLATPLDEIYPTIIQRSIDDSMDLSIMIFKDDIIFKTDDSYTNGIGLGSFNAEDFIGKVLFVYGDTEYIEDQQMYAVIYNYNADGSIGDMIFDIELCEKDVQLHNDELIAFNISNNNYSKLVAACKAGDIIVFYVNDEVYAVASLTGFTKAYNNPIKY